MLLTSCSCFLLSLWCVLSWLLLRRCDCYYDAMLSQCAVSVRLLLLPKATALNYWSLRVCVCVCLVVIRKIIKMIVACWKPLLFALKAIAGFWAPSDTKMSVYLLITWGEIWRGHLYPSPPESLPAGHVQGCVHKRKWGDLCGRKRLHWDDSRGDGKGEATAGWLQQSENHRQTVPINLGLIWHSSSIS